MSHFAGTEQKLRKRTPEEVRLQAASENRQWWCGRDVTWRGRSFQVRATATGKARSPTVVYGGPAVMWCDDLGLDGL